MHRRSFLQAMILAVPAAIMLGARKGPQTYEVVIPAKLDRGTFKMVGVNWVTEPIPPLKPKSKPLLTEPEKELTDASDRV